MVENLVDKNDQDSIHTLYYTYYVLVIIIIAIIRVRIVIEVLGLHAAERLLLHARLLKFVGGRRGVAGLPLVILVLVRRLRIRRVRMLLILWQCLAFSMVIAVVI
jgi:hypothetical protein